jgi:hypothetical protein
MPITYRIDTQEKVIRTRCFGVVTFEEVVDHFRTLERDPECPESLDVLLDVSEMSSVPKPGNIRNVPYEVARIRDKVRFGACAIVAGNDAIFGMLRIFAVMAERYFRVISVMRSAAEAEAWLVSQRETPAG